LLTNQNLITVDSKRTEQKLIRLSQMFEPEHKTPSNADAYFESTKIKNLTFLKHCLFKQYGVFKGKVFKQKRDTTTNWKSHQENFDSQTKLRLTKTQQ